MAIECSLKNTHVWKRVGDLDCVVIAKTVNYNDVLRPAQSGKRARDVWRFVVGEYQGCDLVQHLSTCVANHILPEPRRAAVKREAEIDKAVGFYQLRERVDAE